MGGGGEGVKTAFHNYRKRARLHRMTKWEIGNKKRRREIDEVLKLIKSKEQRI